MNMSVFISFFTFKYENKSHSAFNFGHKICSIHSLEKNEKKKVNFQKTRIYFINVKQTNK